MQTNVFAKCFEALTRIIIKTQRFENKMAEIKSEK